MGNQQCLPSEWLQQYYSFYAIALLYGPKDMIVFREDIKKRFKVDEFTHDQRVAIVNLFDILRQHRDKHHLPSGM